MNCIQYRTLSALAIIYLLPSPSILVQVQATFSIVATDNHSRQVGGAGASCNPSGDIFSGLYLSAPNRSVLHTQALLLERSSPIVATAELMMERNESIRDVLDAMEDMDGGDFTTLSVGDFPSSELRQYGMANFVTNGGYTGRSLETAYAMAGMVEGTEQIDTGSEQLVDGRYSYHALGNDVARGTVESLQTGFLNQDYIDNDNNNNHNNSNSTDNKNNNYINYDCTMAKRLMAAMESVLQDGLGDMRCIKDHNGISATGAYLHVDSPDGRVLVHINKAGDGSYEPIKELKREFLQWQESNGCQNIVDDEVDNQAASDNIIMEGIGIINKAATAEAELSPSDGASTISSEEDETRTSSSSSNAVTISSIAAIMCFILPAVAAVAFWRVRYYQKRMTASGLESMA